MKNSKKPAKRYRDTMRREYEFSAALRGTTAKRYAQSSNIAVIDPEVLDVFPNSESVNEALRAFAPVLRKRRHAKRKNA